MLRKTLCVLFLLLPLCGYAQLLVDFEEGNLNKWLQLPDSAWTATSSNGKISGSFSLRHTRNVSSSGNYTDYISHEIENFSLTEGTTVWRFRMRYNYNPTGTNKWAVLLMADKNLLQWPGGNYRAYAVGVNQAPGVNDKRLCLYALENGNYTELLKTSINWNDSIGTSATTVVSMEIKRDPAGEWRFYVGKNTGFDSLKLQGVVTDERFLEANYFGAINTYTSNSSGGQKFWLDDISISSSVFPSAITSIEQKGITSLLVNFTKPLLREGLLDTAKFLLSANTLSVYPQTIEIKSATQLQLNFKQLPRGNVVLYVQHLLDENNNIVISSKNLSVNFHLFGDVVINEIMAAPAPSAGLPEVPYIELFNRLDIPVSLSGWKLEYTAPSSGNTTEGSISTVVIPPKGYMILCSSASLDLMRTYGNATNVSYLSSLTKSGKVLSLKSNDGTLINRVTYSDKWVTDDIKSAGGWSLEKIDEDNLSEAPANWAVSIDRNGGTPGRENSIKAGNPDKDAPMLASFRLLDNHRLLLIFDEPFDTLQAKHTNAYSADHGIGNPQQVTILNTIPSQVELYFETPFTEGIVYELSITTPFCDLAGNTPFIKQLFGNMPSPRQNEMVVNELLFHPYSGGADFVEIFNRSGKTFDLRQVKIANRDKNTDIASVHPITLQYYLAPGDYVVFTTDLDALRLFYTVPYPEKVLVLPSLPSYPNESGCVVLLNDQDAVIDEFTYTEKMHSGFISNATGISLERVSPELPGNERSNWQSAAQDVGFATPTYRNSQYNTQASAANGNFTLPYEVFSPDGDGYNDILFIDYQLPASGYAVSITIYDAQGRLVCELEKNTLLGTSGRFAWDGTRHDRRKAAVGMYVILIEAYDLKGNVLRIKKSCALAMR